MSTWHLSLRQQPALRLDLRSVTPAALADLSAAQIEQLPLPLGTALAPLGEWFNVKPLASDSLDLLLEGDLSRVDRIGWQLGQGRVRVEGSVGDYLGACMRGGDLVVTGSAGDLAACEMAGGRLEIVGNAGDFVASTLPGSMDGMRGGTLVVRGNVGQRCADRMRRGTLVIHGDAGDFLASRLVAGSIALAGAAGRIRPGACAVARWSLRRATRRSSWCPARPLCRPAPRRLSSGNCWRATWPNTAAPLPACRSAESRAGWVIWRWTARVRSSCPRDAGAAVEILPAIRT